MIEQRLDLKQAFSSRNAATAQGVWCGKSLNLRRTRSTGKPIHGLNAEKQAYPRGQQQLIAVEESKRAGGSRLDPQATREREEMINKHKLN